MYRCCECGAYLDTANEPHECEKPKPQRPRKPRFLTDDVPARQAEEARRRERKAYQEWDYR